METIYRTPDRIGALYKTWTCRDREYDKGGKLLEDPDYYYHYDAEGNLIFKEYRKPHTEAVILINKKQRAKELGIEYRSTGTGWQYDWYSNGMLRRVVRPDGKSVEFWYDALGRRTGKFYNGKLTRWVWDGNTPLHECMMDFKDMDSLRSPILPDDENLITWIFEDGTFVPAAKITKDEQYSIVTDYLGTPIQVYNQNAEKTWDCTLDIYGKVRIFEGSSLSDCPFRYQGQYEDEETGLYYNRFRYYSSDIGGYISQDPIRLLGNNPTFYGYVRDLNLWLDPLGLETYFTRLGNFGEEQVIGALNNSGNYTHVFQVQNAANQGIDIVAKTPDGHYDIFEVKTTRGGSMPSLYRDQLNPNDFIQSRLRTAGENSGAFRLSSEKAADINANIGKKYLVEVEVGTGAKGRWYVENMQQKDWDTEANRIKGGGH